MNLVDMNSVDIFGSDYNDTIFDLKNVSFDYPSLEIVEEPIQTALVTIFSVTAFFSLASNVCVILVLSISTRTSRELKSFLVNLAVSDVLMAVFSIPFTYTMFLLGRWIFAPWFCPVVLTMQHVSVFVSVYTLAAIAIDRYKAITDPLGSRVTASRNGMVIASIWICSFFLSSVQLIVSRARPFRYDNQVYYDCTEGWDTPLAGQIYTIFIFCVSFFFPLLSLGFTYMVIGLKLWRRHVPGNADTARDSVNVRAKWKVIKMLLTIVILFALCWLPLQLFILVFYFYPELATYNTESQRNIYAISYFACLWLANANSFVNPLIYSFMSENFRYDLKDVISRIFRICRNERSRFRRDLSVRTTHSRIFFRQSRDTPPSHGGQSSIELVRVPSPKYV
ncbi:7 transmembrane receptor (rhodopsin family) [Nesidiocoris tenuis]|uniref:7 transmembrane receptor (Rhodopsin family) n=1 Tax=Nesidiocoris tenuis TaxID=355587 RepID=A0ABN7A6A6_9HEMI|nr:7 transmembrane receptor (rhodopsin family) [Nesidiocoris tenuis]